MGDQDRIRCRKFTLISLIVIFIITEIVFTVYGIERGYDLLEEQKTDKMSDMEVENTKDQLRNLLIAGCVISIAIYIMGIIGAFLEHYCLTLTFAIIMTLGTLGALFQALQWPIRWLYVVVCLFITLVAYILAMDIKKKQGQVKCCCCTC